ncbi:MAG: flagellar basal body rod protein FlgC [Alkalibacterium sp.]|nr:flagellar basal body rod protein FlgC [Alkalibacterium sp.]
MNTTRTEEGQGPYIKQQVLFEENLEQVKSGFTGDISTKSRRGKNRQSEADEDNFRLVYEPGHPDANEEGYVAFPNVDMADEMVDMMTAIRSYDANVTAINTSKDMLKRAMEIGGE